VRLIKTNVLNEIVLQSYNRNSNEYRLMNKKDVNALCTNAVGVGR
jgi:hypothetical protein